MGATDYCLRLTRGVDLQQSAATLSPFGYPPLDTVSPLLSATSQYNDICWKGAPDGFRDLDKFFPPAEFVFGGGAVLGLTPLRYLFASKPGEYCLGVFDNGMSGTLIGGVSVRDVVVTVRGGVNKGVGMGRGIKGDKGLW